MNKKLWKTIILTVILLVGQSSSQALPTVVFHGIHDDCHGWMLDVAINITK